MFFAGMKFGAGFCVGTILCAVATLGLPLLIADLVRRYRDSSLNQKHVDERARESLRDALWTRASEPEFDRLKVRDVGSSRIYTRTVITWDERGQLEQRRKDVS